MSSLDLKALDIFINTPVTQDMIHKIVVHTLQVLPCKDSKNQTYMCDGQEKPLPSLMTFLTKLVRYTNVYTGTLMATLVYLEKLKSKLPQNAQGLPCTRHRILLSCLILSSKFHNDSSPKNHHWANYTDGLFNAKDINLMERQLLYLLNWDLKVNNEEMLASVSSFVEPIKNDLVKNAKMKKFMARQRMEAESLSVSSSPSSSSSSSSSPIPSHYRQNSSSLISSSALISCSSSCSSLNSSISVAKKIATNPYSKASRSSVDPYIELTALNEEKQLQTLLKSLNQSFVV